MEVPQERQARWVRELSLATPYLLDDFLCIPETATLIPNISIFKNHYFHTI